MKMGHAKGTKREKQGSQDWYQRYFEEHLARIEREQAGKAQTQPRIQFQTVTTTRYTRVQWSDDYGQTWQEPEDAPIEVARAWQAIQATQAA